MTLFVVQRKTNKRTFVWLKQKQSFGVALDHPVPIIGPSLCTNVIHTIHPMELHENQGLSCFIKPPGIMDFYFTRPELRDGNGERGEKNSALQAHSNAGT